jgi:hypothetical protein
MTRRSGSVIVEVSYEVEVEYEEWTGMYGEDADGHRGALETEFVITQLTGQTDQTPSQALSDAQAAFLADPGRWLK